MAATLLADRYEVLRQLGQQPGRRTLLAYDSQTQQQVVIKLIALAQQLEGDALRLFQREAETLKTLAHPAIPQYIDYFEMNSRAGRGLALVQTYMQGKSLEEYVNSGRIFSETEVKAIARAVLTILVYLHSQEPPVIHRDIKPGNILVGTSPQGETGRIYLVDFGSVKSFSDNEETNSFTVVGTYGYMPPEQFSGRAIPASDLYSLGATLLTLLTGTHPSSLPQRGMRIDVQQIPNLSLELGEWLSRLTEPNLARRFTSAQEALVALDVPLPSAPPVPKAVAQPVDSKIQYLRQGETLELVIPSSLGKTRLEITAQQISLSKQMFGLRYSRPKTARRRDIEQIEYIKPTYTESQGAAVEPEIIIHAKDQQFELGGGQLTEAELDWLAYELCDVLKLPITRRHA
ncbi:serine/threonine protein kinase [Trichothermofontia sichuanensis B231]|uniref:serine/threonine protein kinase n=1 Tax=Trichothermofontia sichuanensis TaxID=3045816 RepID=UPI0022482B5D|nr:serine/threonine-protein kinase [Trichothermofontia sichuanensis]UZQ54699.1 serine/threonine protein kinase [Trichothermofontia sichuanensis B231]